ncbi:hypothetical protein ACFQ08_16805, partial [Streptosporangium algeriense]
EDPDLRTLGLAEDLGGGPTEDNIPSTILDLTTAVPRLLRKGAIPVGRLRGVVGYVATDGDPEPDAEPEKPDAEPKPEAKAGPAPEAKPEAGAEAKPEAGAKPDSRG